MGVFSSDKSRKAKGGEAPKGAKGRKSRRPHFREKKEDGGHYQETVGGDLRMARSGRGLSLSDVATALKLKVEHIRALEESDFDALPGKTYAIGFVRAYAEMMGLRSEEVIRRFKAEMTGAEELKFNAITAKERKRRIPLGQFITAAVTVVLAIAVWRSADVAMKAGGDVLEAFNPRLPDVLSTQSDSKVEMAAVTEEDEPASEEDVAIPVAEGDIAETAHAVPVGPSQSATTMTRPATTSFSARSGLVDRGPAPDVVDGTRWGEENHDARLRLRAVKDTWLRIEVDERVMFERILKAGDSYSPPNSESTVIATRNAGGLEIYVDGTYARRLGGEGEALAGAYLDPEAFLSGP